MNELEAAFVAILADSIDQLSLGQRNPYGRDPRPGLYARKYLSKINRAIIAARTLGALPAGVASLSMEEVEKMGIKMRSLGTLKMHDQIRATLVEMLRERGIPDQLLSAASDNADEIAASAYAPRS